MEYTWSFDKDSEYWNNFVYGTVEECIEEAKDSKKYFNEYKDCNKVYVANTIPFVPEVDIEHILEQIMEDAYDDCGDCTDGWYSYDYKKNEELNELQKEMDEVLHKWLKKYGYYPNFYCIGNIKEYDLENNNSNE